MCYMTVTMACLRVTDHQCSTYPDQCDYQVKTQPTNPTKFELPTFTIPQKDGVNFPQKWIVAGQSSCIE